MRKNSVMKGLLLAFALTTAVALVGCGDDKAEKKEILPPEITATNDGLFWTQAEGATAYKYRFNEGKYQKTDETQVAFPTEEGEYLFEIYSLGGGAESETASFVFSVASQTATATVQDNVVSFVGENIYYSVNGGQESALGEKDSLDFSAAQVGEDYTVTYYTKGGFWSESENTYYVDSEKQTATVSVTATLSMPEFTVSGNSLVFSEVTGATAYEVKIDGGVVTVSNRTIAFPDEVGTHVISVRAIGGNGYKNSAERVYEMQTKERGIPSVTYSQEEDEISFSSDYVGLMAVFSGDDFVVVNGSSIAYEDGVTLRLNGAYDETERTYYLASKPLVIAKRSAPTISFAKDGEIAWNETDEGEALTYFVSLQTSGEDFVERKTNRLNVAEYPAGEYTLKVYGGQYLEETDLGAIFYLPGHIGEISLRILESPELDFKTGKLLWTKDVYAYGYEYKAPNGEWETAGNSGEISALLMGEYLVRAIGNETAGAFVVNSLPSSIAFDPTLKTVVADQTKEELANFNFQDYANYLSAPIAEQSTGKGGVEILSQSEDDAEQSVLAGATDGVLKIVATKKAPKNSNLWGNSDGAQFNLFKSYPVSASGSITFRVYMQSNELRTTTGWLYPDKETTVDLEGRIVFSIVGKSITDGSLVAKSSYVTIETDKWVEYTLSLSGYVNAISEITGVAVYFQNVGKEGDVIYWDGMSYNSAILCNQDEINFNDMPAYANAVSSYHGVELVKDEVFGEEVNVLHAKNVYQRYDVNVLYDDIVLHAGDTLAITMKAIATQTTGGGIYFGSAWKVNFTSSETEEWKTYTIAVAQETVLSSLVFHVYDAHCVYQLYIESIYVERAIGGEPILCSSDVVNFDSNPEYKNAVLFDGAQGVAIVRERVDGEKVKVLHAINVYQSLDVAIAYDELSLHAGDTITIVMKAVSKVGEQGNGGCINVNGAYMKSFVSTPDGEWATYSFTLAEDITLENLTFHVYNPNYVYQLYIASIVIDRAE